MDVFTKIKRSQIMSRIRSTATTPERRLYVVVRELLGHRWKIELNVSRLPGKPDLVVPSLKLVVLADGCFYHSCNRHGHEPKSNREYWVPKLLRNKRRDVESRKKLRSLGFEVVRIWEHDLKRTTVNRTYRKLQRKIIAIQNSKRSD